MDNPDTMLSGYSTTFSHDEVERRLHIHFCVCFSACLKSIRNGGYGNDDVFKATQNHETLF